jgi:acyl dehydratase
MVDPLTYDAAEVGTVAAQHSFPIGRLDLVRYAGASGDFNPIHVNERIAKLVGLPDVIAHGMLTMALAGRVVTDIAGDPGAVEHYGVRFTSMVVVPDDDHGATVDVTATVAEKLGDNRVRFDVEARVGDTKVLGRATAVARLK